MDIKQMIFDLARYEKELCMLGDFTSEDEAWFNDILGFPDGFVSDDVFGLSVSDISNLVFDFIEHCREVKGE